MTGKRVHRRWVGGHIDGLGSWIESGGMGKYNRWIGWLDIRGRGIGRWMGRWVDWIDKWTNGWIEWLDTRKG